MSETNDKHNQCTRVNPKNVINPTGVDSTETNKVTGVENLDNRNNPNHYSSQNQRYNLRANRKQNYTHLKGRKNDGSLPVRKDTIQ